MTESELLHGSPVSWSRGQKVVHPSRQTYVALLKKLLDDGFTMCTDLTAVDYLTHPGRELPAGVEAERFEVVVNLISITSKDRLRVRVQVPESDPTIASAFDLWPGTEAMEREVFDMFGILFSGHPDLRRILTDYGFRGHPLRKDFPTTGYVEVRYDEALKRVVYEPVKLVQEYRQFDFLSPWEGAKYVLPGDEKQA